MLHFLFLCDLGGCKHGLMVALPKTQRDKDEIMVVTECFSMMAYFVDCIKCGDAPHIVPLCFKEIIMLHGQPKSIILDRDTKFVFHF